MLDLIQSLQIVANAQKTCRYCQSARSRRESKLKQRGRNSNTIKHQRSPSGGKTALVNTRQNVSQFGSCSAIPVVAVPVVAHWQDGMVFAVYGEWAGCQTERGNRLR